MSGLSTRRYHYRVEHVDDPGDGTGLERHLEETADHAWQAVHYERLSDRSWLVVYEQPAVTPKSR